MKGVGETTSTAGSAAAAAGGAGAPAGSTAAGGAGAPAGSAAAAAGGAGASAGGTAAAAGAARVDEIAAKKHTDDLNALIEARVLLNHLLGGLAAPLPFEALCRLGQLLGSISWDENNTQCIRNKHGFRNRHKEAGNKKNATGAKLDFEALAHLDELSTQPSVVALLNAQLPGVIASLECLRDKIVFILRSELPHLNLEQRQKVPDLLPLTSTATTDSNEVGLLLAAVSYCHDGICFKRLIHLLMEFFIGDLASLNLSDRINRYYLGYFFTQLGETAKEVSDFVKPELFSDAERNIFRFLFTKLGHYRQVIKSRSGIVIGEDTTRLVNMRFQLYQIQSELMGFLSAIEKAHGEGLAVYLRGDFTNAILAMPGFQFIVSRCIDRLEVAVIDPRKKIPDLEAEAEAERKRIADNAAHLSQLQAQLEAKGSGAGGGASAAPAVVIGAEAPVPAAAAVSTEEEKRPLFLYNSLYTTKLAKQVLALIGFCPEELIEASDFTLEQKRLARFIRKHATIRVINPEKFPVLRNIFPAYALSVSLRMQECLIDNAIDYEQSLPPLSSLTFPVGSHQRLTALSNEIAAVTLRIRKHWEIEYDLMSRVNKIRFLLPPGMRVEDRRAPVVASAAPAPGASAPAPAAAAAAAAATPASVSKYERKLKDIRREAIFLRFILLQLKDMREPIDPRRKRALAQAEKMSFGMLGQLYKEIRRDHLEELSQNLFEHSLLSRDMYDAMLIRHKQVSHNVFNCDEAVLQQAIEEKVVPWIQDFQYMLFLFPRAEAYRDDELQTLVDIDFRYSVRVSSLSQGHKNLLIQYLQIVALNRFMRSQEALALHAALVIPPDIDPNLAAEIHWQASFSYRNLNQFRPCVTMLERTIAAARAISHEPTRLRRIYGAYADLGIAYTELNEFENAKQALLEVVSHPLQLTAHQFIQSTYLLATAETFNKKYEEARACLELLFVKYHSYFCVRGNYQSSVLSLLSQLTSIYLDDFNLFAARDCFALAEQALKQCAGQLIVMQGQAAIYSSHMLDDPKLRCKMLEAIVADNERTAGVVADVYRHFLEREKEVAFFPYLLNRHNQEYVFLQAALLAGDVERVRTLLPGMDWLVREEGWNFLAEVQHRIERLKKNVYALELEFLKPPREKDFKAIIQYKNKLKKSKKLLTALFMQASIQALSSGNVELAQLLMKQSILCEGIVGFFQMEAEIILQRVHTELLSSGRWTEGLLLDNARFIASAMEGWLNRTTIDFHQLKLYLQQVEGFAAAPTDPVAGIILCSFRRPSIIKRYQACGDILAVVDLTQELERVVAEGGSLSPVPPVAVVEFNGTTFFLQHIELVDLGRGSAAGGAGASSAEGARVSPLVSSRRTSLRAPTAAAAREASAAASSAAEAVLAPAPAASPAAAIPAAAASAAKVTSAGAAAATPDADFAGLPGLQTRSRRRRH